MPLKHRQVLLFDQCRSGVGSRFPVRYERGVRATERFIEMTEKRDSRNLVLSQKCLKAIFTTIRLVTESRNETQCPSPLAGLSIM